MTYQYRHIGGDLIPANSAFEMGGKAFAANWLSLATDEDLAAVGIEKEMVTEAAPDRAELVRRIDRERDRRIALGATVTVGGHEFVVQTRHGDDFRNINGLVSEGIVRVIAGDVNQTIRFRDAANEEWLMTGGEMIQVGQQVGAHVDAIYRKSWALKDLETIPADVTADEHW